MTPGLDPSAGAPSRTGTGAGVAAGLGPQSGAGVDSVPGLGPQTGAGSVPGLGEQAGAGADSVPGLGAQADAGVDSVPGLGAQAGAGNRPVLLVSACLVGVCCNHRGEASPSAGVRALAQRYRLVPMCPETAGGLPTPRPPAERQPSGAVSTADGDDVTDAYRLGAGAAVTLAKAVEAAAAVLKARSPSCGSDEIYDGSFARQRVPGQGVTAAALRSEGFTVISEERLADLPALAPEG